MLWVIAFACGLWQLGFFLKVPKQQRWLLIAILFLAVILIQLTSYKIELNKQYFCDKIELVRDYQNQKYL